MPEVRSGMRGDSKDAERKQQYSDLASMWRLIAEDV
jgi:hypothetical protein